MKTIIFTDGSSRGNPGPGGWGSIILQSNGSDFDVRELGGREEKTTNNRMELMAAIMSIESISESSDITVYTDSSYLIKGITSWVKTWKKTNWLTKMKEDVLNKDLWERLDVACENRTIIWQQVSGHAGIHGNERCDVIATSFADNMPTKLFEGKLSEYVLKEILSEKRSTLLEEGRPPRPSKSQKAYSYVSSVGGIIEIHKTWAECEARVKGAKGARFKKSISPEDEKIIVDEFGI